MPGVRAATRAVGTRRGSVRAGDRGAGPQDPAATSAVLERCGLRPLPRAVAAVLLGPPGGCGGGDLGSGVGPRLRAGWRSITAAAGRPASTVRGWLSRFAAHAEPIRAAFARLERQVNTGGDMDRLAPAGSAVADAVGQVGAACAAVRRALGPGVCTVSAAEMVAACSGGWLLAARPPAADGKSINTSPHL